MGDAAHKTPSVNQILMEEDFKELLLQKPEKLGDDGAETWIILLGSCVSHVITIHLSKQMPIVTHPWSK